MSAGSLLRESRLKMNQTLNQMSLKTGVPLPNLSLHENSHRPPTHKFLRKVAKGYEIPLVRLLIAAGHLTQADLYEYKESLNSYESTLDTCPTTGGNPCSMCNGDYCARHLNDKCDCDILERHNIY